MSIGTWDPDTPNHNHSFEVEIELLRQFISLSRANAWDQIQSCLSVQRLQQQSQLMQLSKERWFSIANDFDNNEIVQLIRFFTIAEMNLLGWDAGAHSPVVWLVKVLRQRKNPPDRELLIWIKENSSNKFLPNGALI